MNKKALKEEKKKRIAERVKQGTEQPPCPHFEQCGGCTYQTLTYEEQKLFKLEQVQSLIKPLLPNTVLKSCESSPNRWEYRNKMEFSFGDETKGGPLTLGLHKRSSFYDIINVEQCKIVPEDYRKILKRTREYFTERKVPFFHKISHKGYLRHLMIRRGEVSGELLICLVTTSERNCDLHSYAKELLSLDLKGQISGILHMVNDRPSDMVASDETIVLYGKNYFYEELLGLKFKISPFSFFQTNSSGAEVLYEKVREYIGGGIDNKVIFDLYSGTGTIAQVLARAAKKIVGIEIVEEAVLAATENAQMNGLKNCTFITGDVRKVLDEVAERPDVIILDPPREGVHPKALRKIADYHAKNVVYISCMPTSLVRDLEVFLDAGYQVKNAECVDMFPWTKNIETICLLSKQCF
ncbi:MAG: 23S rRNA (uracil(1939)-C(5))-methyltransferase RlmD [Lachnoclostridium sp.]|jgi:23S rRNA (uracil-5-)-methyltransferase RumA|nr:23S rRNA (uracil(1939)-C(5))-methyltransferase RlmD [Lachnoclostridium sp.]